MATPKRSAQPKRKATRTVPTATKRKTEDTALEPAARAFALIRPQLAEIDPAVLWSLKGDLQRAAIAALGVVRWASSGEPLRRFKAAAAAPVLRFELKALKRLENAAYAAYYARHQALRAAEASEKRIPTALDNESAEFRARVFKLCEYYLSEIPEALEVLDYVRPGSGYLDRANDLLALAGLLKKYRAILSKDLVNWRNGDDKTALRLHAALLAALGLASDAEAIDWVDMSARAWHELRAAYAEVEAVGRCLYRNENPDRLFPNLIAVSRDSRSPSKPDEQPSPTPSPSPLPTN